MSSAQVGACALGNWCFLLVGDGKFRGFHPHSSCCW